MAEAPYNFKRPSAQGRQSKRTLSVSLPQNCISEGEQPKTKKARARPSTYITVGKKPKCTKATGSSARSSEQLEKTAKKRSKATQTAPSCAQSSEQLQKAPKKRSKATKASASSGQSSNQLKSLAKGKNKASVSASGQTSKQLRDAAKKTPVAAVEKPLPTQPLQLASSTYCAKCGAKKFQFESKHFCCGDGDVKIVANDYPPELVRLFTSKDEDAVHFRKYARLYNNLFAFSSIGGKYERETHKGIYVFKLHGQIYHSVPDLIPNEKGPKYLQLYFYDGQNELKHRADCFPELRQDVIDILMRVTKDNPYARFFRSLKEVTVNESTNIIINSNTVPDQRVYNAPTSDEVAAIWPDSVSSSQSSWPHIIVTGKSTEIHRIAHYYGCYDPLQYPLLFPKGECGWHQGLKKVSHGRDRQLATESDPIQSCAVHTPAEFLDAEAARSSGRHTRADKYISAREYYAYMIQIRIGNMLLRAGRAFLQYIVDMYIKVENTRLDFFRRNQDTIRADLYKGILDTVESGETNAANVGHKFILPPSFLGGPRDMKRRYLNAMALVQKYGKPDLFVTVTCNANWPEIKAELLPGEAAQDRPDLVARIFRAKLIALRKKIKKEKIFGKVAAMIYVVEFQKRGLPHAHFLLILQPQYKMKCPADYDKFVCAEIPSVNQPELRKIVLQHMMHGPCGELNPECPCMRKKDNVSSCKNGYPKQFTPQTTTNKDGYPCYRRTDTGEQVKVRGAYLDNRWVVPYNPYLSSLFDCHLNVEVCSTIKAVKYLYKYVYKGHDRVAFSVSAEDKNSGDEIAQYQSGRWVSPCEAAWRIFGFDLFEIYPPVMPLSVHMPEMNTVCVRPHEKLDVGIASGVYAKTPLTEFLRLNAASENGLGYFYGEFPEHYRWDATAKAWFGRKRKTKMVGRLTFVAPSEGERFYLRLLLLNVKSPKSFTDLRTIHGHVCVSFKEACLKAGILEVDDAANICLAEATEIQLPIALRRLFATVLIFCQPEDPEQLWCRYYAALSEDFAKKNPGAETRIKNLTVRSIEQHLEAMGKSLGECGLGSLSDSTDSVIDRTKDIQDALDAPIPQSCIDSRSLLNAAQKEAFTSIMEHVTQGKPGAFFVDGPGGTGKTFLYNALYAEVRLMNKIVLPTATSGIAAANIPSGRTAHSRFKIPVDSDCSLACSVSKQSSLAALIKETALIIWDEASMANKQNLESLDLLLQDICDNNIVFGGKVIVFGGDFRQVLPVVPNKSQKEAVDASVVSSYIWNHLKRFRLTENLRAREDPAFSDFLLALGNGELQAMESDLVQLPTQIVKTFPPEEDPILEYLESTFPELNSGSLDPKIFSRRAVLTPINDDVDSINSFMIDKFPGEARTYTSYDTILDDTGNIYPTEFLNKLCPGGMSPHNLVLKKDCPVILLRNLLPSSGLCNGTRLICKRFFSNLIECVIAVGQYQGEHVFIPRIKLRPSNSQKYPFQFQRSQFPIKLSFAMTINKSQGQTLDQVLVYLPRSCFSHGQLYVALSRARTADKIKVLSVAPAIEYAQTSVKNVVSYTVLGLAGVI